MQSFESWIRNQPKFSTLIVPRRLASTVAVLKENLLNPAVKTSKKRTGQPISLATKSTNAAGEIKALFHDGRESVAHLQDTEFFMKLS